MCDVLGGHATLEESVTNLVTARLVLEADGEVVLAIMREVEFHTFLSGYAQVNIPLAQIAQECRVVELPNLQSSQNSARKLAEGKKSRSGAHGALASPSCPRDMASCLMRKGMTQG